MYDRNMDGYLDRQILRCMKGTTADEPIPLVGIFASIDCQERILLTHEELSGGLTRLIESGQCAEVGKHQFYEVAGTNPRPSTFSGLSPEEYETACQEYHKWFAEQLEKYDPDAAFTRQKLVIRWKLDEDSFPSEEDEETVLALGDAIEPALEKSGLAEINGIEIATGLIDLLIFGKETDDDMDDIYALVVDTFKSYGCPKGSCIIRCYGPAENCREVFSDEIV